MSDDVADKVGEMTRQFRQGNQSVSIHLLFGLADAEESVISHTTVKSKKTKKKSL